MKCMTVNVANLKGLALVRYDGRRTGLEVNEEFLLTTLWWVSQLSKYPPGRFTWVRSSVNVSSDPFKSLYKTTWAVESVREGAALAKGFKIGFLQFESCLPKLEVVCTPFSTPLDSCCCVKWNTVSKEELNSRGLFPLAFGKIKIQDDPEECSL